MTANDPQAGDDASGPDRNPSGDEFPDPDTPPSGAAPGGGSPPRGKGQFDEAYEVVGRDAAGSSSTDDEPPT